MEFRCRLGTPGGEIIEGVYVADSEDRLRRELEEKGLYVLALHRRGGVPGLKLGTMRRRRIKRSELIIFNQELATLLKAGMPLVQSLDILRQRVSNARFKGVLDAVYDRVKAGTALSDAFAEHGEPFSGVYAASLMAGERSGSLDTVIRRYVAHEKIIATVRRRTMSALIYPALLVAMMVGLIGLIVFRVVPAFTDFYASFDRPLPASTQVIVRVSSFLISNALILVVALAGATVSFVSWLKQPTAKARLQKLLLRLPWGGEIMRKFSTSQLARTLATLLGGGIPLVDALEISVRSIGNRYLAQELEDVRRQVQEGQSFAAALRSRKAFPDVAIKMVEVGESTGALQEMLNSLADFYDEEIDTEVDRFIRMVEPILLVVMGMIIAVVVLALYQPLFQLNQEASS